MPLDYEIHERTLDNGLRVLLAPDRLVPTVTVNLWVGVGSRHEQTGRTGLAHLFEHLMFQGSRNVAEGEHFAALMAHGARLNATTWVDRTNYFETVPSGALDLALWMEADRHGYLLDAVTVENLDNQRDVVKEEKRERYDNRPYGTATARLFEMLFPADHPYHHPTIGSMDDLDAASLGDVHDFFRRHYGPNNTVLTLAGDIGLEQGLDAVERYFGSLPPADIARTPSIEPLTPLERSVRAEILEDVPSDRLYLGWRLPAADTPGFHAADIAFDSLAGLATSRLYRALVRRAGSVSHVSRSATGMVAGNSAGILIADIAEGHSRQEVEEQILTELATLAADGPTEVEMETIRADVERWWLGMLASQDDRADLISHYALLHDDPGYINHYLDTHAAITAEQVRDVAREWLRPESRAVVAYRRKEN